MIMSVTQPPSPLVATMRAAVVTAPGTIRIGDERVPEPAAGEVRIRLEGTGVCQSNIPVWEGREWFRYPHPPGSPGHEGWGVVDAVGDGVTHVVPGDRVAALSYQTYAEYDIAAGDAVLPLPAALDRRPFPGEPLGCAMNILLRSEIRAGDAVAIVGIGFLGALLTRLAANAGATVIAVSRRPFALEVAHHYGADACIAMDDRTRVVERVKSLTGGRMCDCVIEAVGLQESLDLAGELTRERGRLVIAGFHQDGPRQVNMFLWNWRGLDVINAHERDPRVYVDGMRRAIDAVASGILDPGPLYTHRYPLAALDEALEAARSRPDGFLKALVEP